MLSPHAAAFPYCLKLCRPQKRTSDSPSPERRVTDVGHYSLLEKRDTLWPIGLGSSGVPFGSLNSPREMGRHPSPTPPWDRRMLVPSPLPKEEAARSWRQSSTSASLQVGLASSRRGLAILVQLQPPGHSSGFRKCGERQVEGLSHSSFAGA